jgi:predicted O-methyltransferase YrrM
MSTPILSDPEIIGQPGPAYQFNHLAWSYAIAGALLAAVRVGLFSALAEGPASATEVAERCGTDPRNTEKLLMACTALGLLKKEGDLYSNAAPADRYLVPASPLYQGDLVEHLGRQWVRWGEIDHFVRTGRRGSQEIACQRGQSLQERDEDHRIWIMAMHNIAMAGQAASLVAALDLAGCDQLCDVGGGAGSYALALCQEYPALRATIIDVPDTEPMARQLIASFGLEDRVTFRAGDYLKDDYGHGHDVVLLSGVLHGETPEDCRTMLCKAWASLRPTGRAVVQEVLLNKTKSGPLLPALFSLHMTFGASYSGTEIASWMEETGFERVRVCPLEGYSWLNGLVVGERGR